MFYVYIIKSRTDGKLYIGFTNDLKKRFSEHNQGGSLSTKSRKPFTLIYYEAYRSEANAKNREWQLKKYGQAYRRLKERIKISLRL